MIKAGEYMYDIVAWSLQLDRRLSAFLRPLSASRDKTHVPRAKGRVESNRFQSCSSNMCGTC